MPPCARANTSKQATTHTKTRISRAPALTHHVCSALRHVALVAWLLVDEEALVVLHAAMVCILVGSPGACLLEAVGAQHVLVADVRCHGGGAMLVPGSCMCAWPEVSASILHVVGESAS
jgi:hypothetical protein